MGYQLGKAQTLSELFGHWEPLYYHDSVKEMNDAHRSLGIGLPDAPGHTEAEAAGLLGRGPWSINFSMISNKLCVANGNIICTLGFNIKCPLQCNSTTTTSSFSIFKETVVDCSSRVCTWTSGRGQGD